MNRRQVLMALAMIPTTAIARAGEPMAAGYGYLDCENCFERTGRSSADVRVIFNGAEVDLRALTVMACDDKEGYIEVVKRHPNGKPVLRLVHDPANVRVVTERRYGHVRISFVSPRGPQ